MGVLPFRHSLVCQPQHATHLVDSAVTQAVKLLTASVAACLGHLTATPACVRKSQRLRAAGCDRVGQLVMMPGAIADSTSQILLGFTDDPPDEAKLPTILLPHAQRLLDEFETILRTHGRQSTPFYLRRHLISVRWL
jgi:hypothetical protein